MPSPSSTAQKSTATVAIEPFETQAAFWPERPAVAVARATHVGAPLRVVEVGRGIGDGVAAWSGSVSAQQPISRRTGRRSGDQILLPVS